MEAAGAYAVLAVSAAFNGSAFVPLKAARRRCPGLRDEIFQCYWTLAAAAVQLATAPLSCALGQEDCLLFVPLGVVAGVCCFMATVCVFVAVRHLGVAAQPSLVAASFVSFSLLESLLVLGDTVKSGWLLALALALILGCSAGVAYSKQSASAGGQDPSLEVSTLLSDATPKADGDPQPAPSAPAPAGALRAGVGAAIGVGLFGSLVPLLAKLSAVEEILFLPSVGLGLLLANALGIPVRLRVSRALGAAAVPAEQWRSVRGTGLLSGGLWGAGNALLNVGLQGGVALPVASAIYQCSLLVGGLWGIFHFREIRGSAPILAFFVSAAGVVAGIVLLGSGMQRKE